MAKKFFVPLLILVAAMYVAAPILIANAPYEASMGLIQKIFYFHVPSAIAAMLRRRSSASGDARLGR